MILLCVDWKNVLVSLQIYVPMTVWVMSVLMVAMHWVFRRVFPETWKRMQEVERVREEEGRVKILREEGGVEAIVERGAEKDGSESFVKISAV